MTCLFLKKAANFLLCCLHRSLHKEWLGYSWKDYTEQKHKGVVSLYVQDERFKKYYDREQNGCADFLLAAVDFWAEKL